MGRARATARGRRTRRYTHAARMRHTRRPRPSRAHARRSPSPPNLFAPFPFPFLTLSLSATLRIRAPCRLPARLLSLSLSLSSPAFFPPPALLALPARSHYFARPFVFSLSRTLFRTKFPHSSLIPCLFVSPLFSSSHSFRRTFVLPPSPPSPIFFLRFLSRAVPPFFFFCSVSFRIFFCVYLCSRLS